MLHVRTLRRLVAGTALGAVLLAGGASAAHADPFGPATFTMVLPAGETAAGAHPDLVTRFDLNRRDPAGDATLPANQTYGPSGSVRDADVLLPEGLVADPTVAPICGEARIARGGCDRKSAVGELQLTLATPMPNNTDGRFQTFLRDRRQLLYRTNALPGEVAAFQGVVLQFPVRIGVEVGPDGGYRVRAKLRTITEASVFMYAQVTLWGVPADHAGPPATPGPVAWGGPLRETDGSLAPRRAFTALGTSCTGAAQRSSLTLSSWQTGVPIAPVFAELPALTGCAELPFAPSLEVEPAERRAGAPAGYRVALSVPQPWTSPVGEGVTPPPASAHLKDARVELPEGVAISPPSADGLGACTDAQLAVASSADEVCPETSRIGTVRLETPLLEQPLDGSIFLGEQRSQDPASGDMYRLFLTVTGEGVKIKLRGQIKADPRTGRLVASFVDNPQLPFSKLTLSFKGGDRAPLVNPRSCGTHTATGTLTAWSGQVREVSSSFKLDEGCEAAGFAPGFTAGTLSPLAGAYSPFTMTATRADGEQDLARLKLDLPSGLLGALGRVPVCAEAQAASGTCGADTRLGSTTVAVGSGGAPFALPGTVSLAGPYKGQPFSLSVAVPAKAGPFDLGMVVVRSPLVIDANHARVSAPVDDLPQIVGGVPLRYRSISVTLDRPGFMWNATSCERQQIGATLASTAATSVARPVPYQAQGCDRLKVSPRLALKYTDKREFKDGRHPGIEANLSDMVGQANLKTVAVKLPLTASLDPDNASALCEPSAAAARNCPAASIVGTATARTIALHEPVSGPVYFVRGERKNAKGQTVRTLPKLYLKLAGDGVSVDLNADSDVEDDHLVTTFHDIPDVPLQDFKLKINGGKGGIIAATGDPCAADKTTGVIYTGQNGAVTRSAIRMTAPECTPAISSATATSGSVTVRVGGLGVGKLTLSGDRIRTTTRTLRAADFATLTARTRLTTAHRRQLARGRAVTIAIRVRFVPATGKPVTLERKVTIAGAKRKRA